MRISVTLEDCEKYMLPPEKDGTFVSFGNAENEFERLAVLINANLTLLPKPIYVQAGASVKFFSDNVICLDYMPRDTFDAVMRASRVLVGHCGLGFVSEAVLLGKRPFVMARSGSLAEHVNDHQKLFKQYWEPYEIFYDAQLCLANYKKLDLSLGREKAMLFDGNPLWSDLRSRIINS